MKRCMVGFGLVVAAALAGADNVPVAPHYAVEFQGRTQVVASFGAFDILAEALGRIPDDATLPDFTSFTVGGYYRVIPNLKVGAFYRLQAGARHDDDWVQNSSPPPDWLWQHTTARLENVLLLDASPRFQLSFLPGENWVFMLKTRYIYNAFDGEQSLMARPELTYFWIHDRIPVLNAALSYEMYFPLNFGSTLLYEAYPYLTLLWHATPEIGVELGAAYKTTIWSTSSMERATDGVIYSVPFSSWVVSMGLVWTLAF
jgi:hypothetical protein